VTNSLDPGARRADVGRTKRLKEATHEMHERLDKSIMMHKAFESLARYGLFVRVQHQFHREIDALVLKRAVGRGETLTAGDVAVQKKVIAGLASPFVTRVEEFSGRLTRRPLPQGTAVTAEALTAALLIHRGQNVTLAAVSNGIEVRAPGLALADAAAHGRVRVQNLNSLKIVEGVADTDSVVRVTF